MNKQTLLAIGVGTTNWKAVLFRGNGNLIGQKSIEAIVENDGSGTSYSSETLWQSISSLSYELVTELSANPDAVCVTSMAEAGFPLGKDRNTLYNAITWFDQRSIFQAEKVGQIVGKSKLFAITGLGTGGVRSNFIPEVGPAGSIIGKVTPRAAIETGLLRGTPVVLGGHDHHCAFWASWALLQDGTIFDSAGTVDGVMTGIPSNGILPETYKHVGINSELADFKRQSID